LKNYPGVIPPDPHHVKEEGQERKGGRERRGLGTQLGRRGVVWDRKGEEGMRVIQRKGMGREEKGMKAGGKRSLGPKQNSWIRH
jgi:hypothetical protein